MSKLNLEKAVQRDKCPQDSDSQANQADCNITSSVRGNRPDIACGSEDCGDLSRSTAFSRLIMMRHGQSEWNRLNRFTGWVDIPLSWEGIEEAIEGGKKIKDIPIDVIFMTTLVRSQMTAMLAMTQHSSGKVPLITHPGEGKLEEWAKIASPEATETTIPVITCWELNERMYGDLQGLNKAETAEKFGAEQVKVWRRSYSTRPPNGESLEMTAARSIPYFENKIVPFLKDGKNVFVSAHGNSIRSIVMLLDNLSHDEVVNLEIPTGIPIIYNYHHGKFTKEI